MKKLIFVFIFSFLSIISFSQTEVSIYEIQGQTASSPYADQTVTTQGVVTATYTDFYFIQDGEGAWNAVMVFDEGHTALRGDSISITGEVTEYYDMTELKDISDYTVLKSNAVIPEPLLLNTGDVADEQYESVLVKVDSAMCTALDLGFGEWQVNDGTGNVRVDDLGYAYTPILIELYDVIGPVNYSFDNYKIEPRDLNDVYFFGYPLYFTKYPEQFDLSKTGFTLSWETNLESVAKIDYGLSEDFELGTVYGQVSATTSHEFEFTTLEAGNVYHMNIASMVSGTDLVTKDYYRTFATVSNSSGDIKVYFNNSVDSTVSTGEYPINTYLKTADTVISYINKAQVSLDMAAYNNNMTTIVNALNDAKDRGVVVRYIYEGDNANTALSSLDDDVPTLEAATSGIMHNKFIIIDAESEDNSWVLTGSTNFTSNNLYTDYNNMICIQDQSLAKAYTLEFNEMWGSEGPTPDEENSRIGYDKTDNTPHDFIIGGTHVGMFFSPSDNPTERIVEVAESIDNDGYFALLSFTKDEISDMLIDKHNAGADIKGIIENIDDAGGEYSNLLSAGVDVLHHSLNHDIHHKYLIVDANAPDSDPMVLTGSHNWSSAAESRNDENTIIIHDAAIANMFYQEFNQRYNELKDISVHEINSSLFNIYPNPAEEFVNISSNEVIQSMVMFDISGKVVLKRELINSNQTQINISDFDPGIYFIQANNEIKKLVIQ